MSKQAQGQHTPGPWTADIDATRSNRLVVRGPKRAVAVVSDAANGDANARLIAAAPDLLAACEKMADLLAVLPELGYLGPSGEPISYSPDGVLAVGRAAIAKARGEGGAA